MAISRSGGGYGPQAAAVVETFPLSINGLHLQKANGDPYLLIVDGLWNFEVQARNTSDIDTILENRAAAGYTGIIMELIENGYSDQSPLWRAAIGNNIPFTTTANNGTLTWTSRTEAYWVTVDYIVNKAKSLDMVVIANPAYWGFGDGTDGWAAALGAASDADLQNYGAFLANRYTQGNVIPCVGGDDAGDGGATTPGVDRNKQWQIMIGWRSVNPNVLITGHTARSGAGGAVDGDSYLAWNTFTGFNFPSIYAKSDATDGYSLAATAYARSAAFWSIEGPYENDGGGGDSSNMRKYGWQVMLSGACGVGYGNYPRWGLGAPGTLGSGIANVISSHLATSGDAETGYLAALFLVYAWQLLEPSTVDGVLVSGSLSSGASRICPALASDGTFAFIYVPSSQTVTVVKSALSPSLIRIRLYNTTDGTFSTHTGSTANTGSVGVATGGERVIVIDAA